MRLKSFKRKPGTILDAFSDSDEHLGTIMVVALPPVLAATNEMKERSDHVPVVIIKRALSIKYRSGRMPRGSVGLWTDCRVEYPE